MKITAEDFLKSKGIWTGTWVHDKSIDENAFKLQDLLEEYYNINLELNKEKV